MEDSTKYEAPGKFILRNRGYEISVTYNITTETRMAEME